MKTINHMLILMGSVLFTSLAQGQVVLEALETSTQYVNDSGSGSDGGSSGGSSGGSGGGPPWRCTRTTKRTPILQSTNYSFQNLPSCSTGAIINSHTYYSWTNNAFLATSTENSYSWCIQNGQEYQVYYDVYAVTECVNVGYMN